MTQTTPIEKKYYPDVINSHVIGRKWICDEDSRLTALGIYRRQSNKREDLPKVMQKGAALDDWLKARPKTYDEEKIRSALDRLIKKTKNGTKPLVLVCQDGIEIEFRVWNDFIGYAASRQYQGVEVISHWDDFRCFWNRATKEKYLWQVEYKGLSSPDWIKFERPAAESQVLITQWVWFPVWRYLGWDVANKTETNYYSLRDYVMLEREFQEWSLEKAEDEMNNAFDLFDGRRAQIAPAPFKCKRCRKKPICTIQNLVKARIIREAQEKREAEKANV